MSEEYFSIKKRYFVVRNQGQDTFFLQRLPLNSSAIFLLQKTLNISNLMEKCVQSMGSLARKHSIQALSNLSIF